MSIAYLLSSDKDAVVWRGPKKDAMIKQFINDVKWGSLDYLIIDTPPGTSDEHLTLCEILAEYNPTGAVIITTPQEVATDDVKKELSFCHKLHIRCLGIVENMSGFVCPHCAHCTDIFSRGGGQRLAERYEVAYLGAIPIDPQLAIAEDQGRAFVTTNHEH
uniref:Cytosolic Fe-S cluster assembly factor NUBP2 n=1 Tax=Lygus hesperus TaxID=30085 RepID=A0A0A9WV55_LYGHE